VFFTHRAADPIRMLGAQTHANIKIGAAYSGILTGLTGKTHQDVEDLAIMRAMPDMIVLAPVDSIECEAAMRWATDHNGPVYLRLARDVCPDVFDPGYQFVLAERRSSSKRERMSFSSLQDLRPIVVRKPRISWRRRELLRVFFTFLRSSRLTRTNLSRPVKDHILWSRSRSIAFTVVLEDW
jgi:Transketolase, pyrimidine binding domain